MNKFLKFARVLMILPILGLTIACTPTVKVEAPDKPIEINMNIKIEQEVRVKVERDLDHEMMNNPDLFGVPAKK
ncbi:MAG: YnbE family lipoprotein [Alphaproteobacteria bacterium]|nr:YnbE family lipoprotein [Alphaproteobacteria bacterium]